MEKIKCFGFDMDYTLAGEYRAFSQLSRTYCVPACIAFSVNTVKTVYMSVRSLYAPLMWSAALMPEFILNKIRFIHLSHASNRMRYSTLRGCNKILNK